MPAFYTANRGPPLVISKHLQNPFSSSEILLTWGNASLSANRGPLFVISKHLQNLFSSSDVFLTHSSVFGHTHVQSTFAQISLSFHLLLNQQSVGRSVTLSLARCGEHSSSPCSTRRGKHSSSTQELIAEPTHAGGGGGETDSQVTSKRSMKYAQKQKLQ